MKVKLIHIPSLPLSFYLITFESFLRVPGLLIWFPQNSVLITVLQQLGEAVFVELLNLEGDLLTYENSGSLCLNKFGEAVESLEGGLFDLRKLRITVPQQVWRGCWVSWGRSLWPAWGRAAGSGYRWWSSQSPPASKGYSRKGSHKNNFKKRGGGARPWQLRKGKMSDKIFLLTVILTIYYIINILYYIKHLTLSPSPVRSAYLILRTGRVVGSSYLQLND